MTQHLGRCAEQLRKAVRHLATSSDSPQKNLTSMYDDSGFDRINTGDFPNGILRNQYLAIRGSLTNATEPHAVVNIAAMSDEQARDVMAQICSLSEAVAYVLGKRSNSG
jgi:hypothetical protein